MKKPKKLLRRPAVTPRLMALARKHPLRSLALALVALVLLFGALPYGLYRHAMNIQASDLATITPIRDSILQAAGSKAPAAVDPKTGDIYLPEAKLYLPRPAQEFGPLQLTYGHYYMDGRSTDIELSVSTKQVFNQTATKLYVAEDLDTLFKEIPKLQACSRGISLRFQPLPEGWTNPELKETVILDNGRTLYIHLDKGCPELSQTVELLAGLKSY